MDSDTVIVGSGVSATQRTLGETIDEEFKEVVRFYGAVETLPEYGECVGTRTTSLCVNTNINTVRSVSEKLDDGFYDAAGVEKFYLTWTKKRALDRAKSALDEKLPKYEVCDYDSLRAHLVSSLSQGGNVDDNLSSGLQVVCHKAFSSGETPAVHGFDAFYGGEDAFSGHYYGQKQDLEEYHDFGFECAAMKHLLNAELIRKL